MATTPMHTTATRLNTIASDWEDVRAICCERLATWSGFAVNMRGTSCAVRSDNHTLPTDWAQWPKHWVAHPSMLKLAEVAARAEGFWGGGHDEATKATGRSRTRGEITQSAADAVCLTVC